MAMKFKTQVIHSIEGDFVYITLYYSPTSDLCAHKPDLTPATARLQLYIIEF